MASNSWMRTLLDRVAKEAESWPEWRKEEAKRRFGGNLEETKQQNSPPVQATASIKKDSPPVT